MPDRFEKHARTVTVLTFLSRLTGLARDAALARIFGLSAIIDAFWFAFIIPNLFRRLFGEGALSAAFLPIFTKLDRDDPAAARALARLTISAMLVVLGGITLMAELILWMLLTRISPDDQSHLAVRLMMIMLPYMPLVCIVAILGTMLQVYGRFGPMAAAPVVLNACIVAAAVSGGNLAIWLPMHRDGDLAIEGHITIVAISVIVAGLLQVIWSIASLRRALHQSPNGQWGGARSPNENVNQHFKRMLRQALPMFIGLGVLQLNAFFDNFIAGYPTAYGPTIAGYEFPLKPGALTALSNAQRLYEFPLGVFGIAVATAIFPALARVAGDGEEDRRRFADTVRRGLRLVVFIGVPASVGLVLVRQQLTAVVFYGERFTAADVDRVAFVLLGYAPAIWAYSMIHTLTRAFYAKGDAMTPVKVAVGMVMLNLALNMTLIWTPLREAGLAWSTAMCATVQVLILLRLSRRYAEHLIESSVRLSWMKTVGATVIMGASVWVTGELMPQRELSWRWSALELAVMVSVGGTAVCVCAAMLGMPELRWALGKSTAAEAAQPE